MLRVFLKESFVPVLLFLAVLCVALIRLSDIAQTRSRAPEVVRVTEEEVRGGLRDDDGSAAAGVGLADLADMLDVDDLIALEAGVGRPGTGWVGRAMEMAANDSLADALVILSPVLAANPHHGSAWFATGSVLSRQGKRQKAIEAYSKAVQYSGGDAKAIPLYNLGVLYREAGRTADAVRAFEEAMEQRPDYQEARMNLAVLLAGEPDTREQAFRMYGQLVRLNPSYAEAYFNRGILWLNEGLTDSAAADFRRTVEADPGFSKAWYNLGRLATRDGRDEEALAYYRNAIKADPSSMKARHNLATVLGRLDRYDEAVLVGGRAVELSASYAPAWYNLAIALSRVERSREAIASYEKVLDLDPAHARAWQNLGVLHAQRGNSRKATECYREALAIDATNRSARYNLALEHRRSGDLAAALEEAMRLNRLYPEHSKTRSFLRTTAKRILETDPENTSALQVLGRLEEPE